MSRFAPLLMLLVVTAPLPAQGRLHRSSRHFAKHARHSAKHARHSARHGGLVKGAVSKPKAFRIRSPFPCGVEVRVNCSYGPGCSPAHRRTEAVHGPNDYYAVDFTRVDRKQGFDRAVVAVAPGVVIKAGWARGGWAPYGKVVYIQHSFRDGEGHRYQSLYAHLNRVKVRRGQRVRPGMVLGTLGGSSSGRLGRLGPHLHFAMYRDAKSTLGGGRAVLPEPLGAYRDLRPGMTFVSCSQPGPERVASLEPLPFTPAAPVAAGGWIAPP